MSVMLDGTKVSASLFKKFCFSLFLSYFLSVSQMLDWLICTQPSAVCEPVREDRLPYTHTHTRSDWIMDRCTHSSAYSDTNTHTPDLILSSSRCLTLHSIWKDDHVVSICMFLKEGDLWECDEVTLSTFFCLWTHLEKQTPSCILCCCCFMLSLFLNSLLYMDLCKHGHIIGALTRA